MRSYHFMFRANTFPEREKADLLIEPYNLDGYSNTELEKAEEIFMQGYNAANTLLDQLKADQGDVYKRQVPMPSITCKVQWKTVIILYPPNARSSSEMD